MKNNILRKRISIVAVSAMLMGVMTGCGEMSNVPINPFTQGRDKLNFNAVIPEDSDGDGTGYIFSAGSVFKPVAKESMYENKNGWSVKYDPENFLLYENGPVTTFVYMGESAGTNMVTVTYTSGQSAEGLIDEIGRPYGDKANYAQGVFPGTEDAGYFVSVDPDTEGSGSYMSAVARDYKDGVLVFECDGHMGEDEFDNMEVSDALANIVDSVQFS